MSSSSSSVWAILAHQHPTAFQAATVRNLSASLSSLMPVHVVLDATTRRNDSCPSKLRRCVQDDGSAVTRMAAAWRELAGVPVAVATLPAVVAAFPSFADRSERLATADVGWRTHEYVLLTLRHEQQLPHADHYWVSESDCFFKGDVSAWVERISASYPSEDLLPRSPPATRGWVHRKQELENQPMFLRNHTQAWHMSYEHVRRFSTRLLDALFTLLAVDAYIWGEALAPTTCRTVAIFSCSIGSEAANEVEGWPIDRWRSLSNPRNPAARYRALAPVPVFAELRSGRWYHGVPMGSTVYLPPRPKSRPPRGPSG